MASFELELSKLFNLHILTPSSQSSIVRSDLEALLGRHSTPLVLDQMSHDSSQPFKTLDYIKYISRRHGLPLNFSSKLLSNIHSLSIPWRNKFQIILIVKYSLEKDSRFISFNQLIDSMSLIFNQTKIHNSEQASYFLPHVLSHLVECISTKISTGNFDPTLSSKLDPFLPFLNPRTKIEILKKLEKEPSPEIQDEINLFERRKEGNSKFHQPGDSILQETGTERNKNRGIQADAVKTQQVVMTSYKQNVSERSEMQSISLANALNSNRSKAAARNTDQSIGSGKKGEKGSDRSWLSFMGTEITNFVKKADDKKTIKEEDLEWLKEKTCYGFRITNATVTQYELDRICYIFWKISDYQAISEDIIKALTQNFFSEQLTSDYETCRLRLLKCFEIYSRRNQGQIPEVMEKKLDSEVMEKKLDSEVMEKKLDSDIMEKLNWFKHQSLCTTDMKRLVWKIFMKNDNNLYSFPMAIEHLKSIKKRGYSSQVDDDPLEFIGKQIVFQQTARDLETKFSFFESLLEIVKDEEHEAIVRIKVSEMCEDFLLHSQVGLSTKWLDIYLTLYGQEMKWSAESKTKFRTSLIKSVLRTFDKDSSDPPTGKTVDLLLGLCTRDVDRKLEALIVVTLGNLGNRPNPIKIRECERLSYKLLRSDTIDEEATVSLESETEHEKEPLGAQVYISAIVANMLVKNMTCFKNSTLTHLVQALEKSDDKMTRILCSECLFESAKIQIFPEFLISSIRPFTLDPVPDIQVFSTASYCIALSQLCRGSFFKISSQDLNWLPKIYAFDQIFVLGEKNFLNYLNPLILKILESQASSVEFSNEIFQLLTFILNSGHVDMELTLNIISRHILGKKKNLIFPLDCFDAVENIFLSEPKLYNLSSSVLTTASSVLGTLLSDSSVEHAHQNFISLNKYDDEMKASFSFLLMAGNNQDLAQFIFEDLTQEIIAHRLGSFLDILDSNFFKKSRSDLGPIFEEDSNFELPSNFMGKRSDEVKAIHCVTLAMATILEYLSHGRKLSFVSFYLMEKMLKVEIEGITNGVIKCLIYAAENGQSLSTKLIGAVFTNFEMSGSESHDEGNLNILSLAYGLVHNNQSLPHAFIEKLVDSFCQQTARGLTIGENQVYDQILVILAKLSQNQNPLPKVKNVAKHFCNLWKNSQNSQQRMGVLLNWKSFLGQEKISKEEKAIELVRRFCKFWKKSKSHRHRLGILETLRGIVSSVSHEDDLRGHEKVNLGQINEIFRNASQHPNSQIQETGLQAILALNWNGAQFCTQDDLKMLLSIQCSSVISPALKETVKEFFSRNVQKLPGILKSELELVGKMEDLEDVDDDDFLDMLEDTCLNQGQGESDQDLQLTLRDVTLMKSQNFLGRLEAILLKKSNQDEDIVLRAVQLIKKFPHNENFPSSIFEAIAFTMANLSDNDEIMEAGSKILEEIVTRTEMSAKITPTLINYLTMSNQDEILIKIFKLGKFPESQFPQEFRAKLKIKVFIHEMTHCFCKHKDEILAEFLNFNFQGILLDQDTLEELLELYEDSLPPVEIMKLISLSIVQNESSAEIYKKAAVILETFITCKNSPNHHAPIIFKAYQKIIEKELTLNLGSCLQILTREFQSISGKPILRNLDQDNLSTILSCILQGVKYANGGGKSFIPWETVELLSHQLLNTSQPSFRQGCFRALASLEKENIKLDEKKTREIEIPNLRAITVHVFTQIFGKDGAEDEMEEDPDFTLEFIDFLFSLKYWDLQSLKEVKEERSEWPKILLMSNFISIFAETEDEKIEMALALKEFYQEQYHHGPEILSLLTLKLVQENWGESSKIIIKILKTLNKLSNEKAMEILEVEFNQFENGARLSLELEEASIVETLENKCSFQVSPRILFMLSNKIVTTMGMEFAQNLVSNISTIDDMQSMDSLLIVLNQLKHFKNVGSKLQSVLHTENEEMSVQEIQILVETEILVSLLPDGIKRERFDRIFKSLLINGISLNQIEKFIQLSIERTKTRPGNFRKIFEHVTFQSSQYKINSTIFTQLVSALKNSDVNWNPTDCIDTCNRIINDFSFDATQGGVKGVNEVISEFKCKNPHLDLTSSMDEENDFAELIVKIMSCKEVSQIHDSTEHICDWTIEDIFDWTVKVKLGHRVSSQDFLIEAFMVTKQGFLLVTNFHLTHVQTLTILLSLSDQDKGKLFQVATGSGKSAIIGIIAAIKSLETNDPVDIYTSSSVLAERDAKEWSKFYSLFGLTCDHNGDKSSCYISGAKICYTRNIVYGDCSQFQFDYLRDTYSDLGTLGGRKCRIAIVDEVDSMFIDDSSKLARLSSTLPGMDLLQILYHLIWDRLSFIKTHLFKLFDQIYYLEGQTGVGSSPGIISYNFSDSENQLQTIENIVEYIIGGGNLNLARIHKVEEIQSFVADHLAKYSLALITNKKIEGFSDGSGVKIKLPKNMLEYAESQIPKWVDSSITAVAFQENVHYIVDNGLVKPVDYKTTGVVQGSTNWNNGLHQFLQIKHGLKLGSESVTTNFLSNMAMFQKYGKNVVGFTGTLGSEESKRVLTDVYNVEYLIIPETHYKRYVRFPDFVAQDAEEWVEEILITTMEETSKRRGVLIICETIKEADMISGALEQFKNVKVKMYTKNMENQEKQIERIHPGDVIVATNLAGRGTDIKTADIETFGGLHVLLTFLPGSLRVEEQAFGRTSRQGKKGTGQLVIISLNEDSSAQVVCAQRDEEENKTLENFESNQLPVIQMKDKLFANFSLLFQTIREKIREERSDWAKVKDLFESAVRRPAPTPYEVIVLQAVEERWSMFLRKLDDGRIPTNEAENEYERFEKEILEDRKKGRLIWTGQNLFYFVQLGNFEYSQDSKFNGTLEKAQKYFDDAIKMDSHFATGAYVGKAYVLLKGQVNILMPDTHDNGYKEEALDLLRKAKPLLHEEMALITVTQSLIQKGSGDNNNALFGQLTEKSNLLGSYLKNVEGTITTIEKSLRRVFCTEMETAEGVESGETRMIQDEIILTTRDIPFEKFNKFHLTFHSLTAREDSGIVLDQAVNTISFDDWTSKALRLKQKVSENLKSFFTKSKSSNLQSKFPISLNFKVDDLGQFVESELMTQKFDFNIEILGAPLIEEKLDINPSKIPKRKNYTVYFFLGKGSGEIKINVGEIEHYEIELHVSPLDKVGIKHFACFKPGMRNEKQELFEHLPSIIGKDEDEVSLKFVGVKYFNEIQKIQNFIKNVGLSISGLNLTLNSIDKDATAIKKSWEEYMKEKFSNISIIMENLDENSAFKVIPHLRKLDIDFVVECQNLTLDTAKFVLGKADLGQEKIVQEELKELTQLFMAERLPLAELKDLSARGICLMVTFNEKKFVPWISVAGVVALAALQATAGAALICTGFGATVGMGLITEGMADLVTAQRIYSTRQFSWTDYSVQKAVSLVISAASMGVSSLKDGAKGASLVVQGAATEAVEQAGTRVLVNGKVLNTTIKVAGKNLKSLAYKQVTVSVVETGARIGLKALGDSLADFCFEQVRAGITKNVGERIDSSFSSKDFRSILSFYYALDKRQLTLRIQEIVDGTTNPKSSAWLQLWSSVGSPLCSGILSSPQFLGSTVTRITMIYGILSSLTEIATVVSRVCTEIQTKLEDEKPTLITILQSHAGLSKETAEKVGSKMTLKEHFEVNVPTNLFITSQQAKNVQEVFNSLETSQKNFSLDSSDVSQMMKTVVDSITSHLIRVANSHLVSPVMSSAVGSLVAKISSDLQNRFLVNESQNTDEQNKIKNEVEQLKKKPENERTPEETKFIQDNDRKNTFASQINFNAKDYTIAYQKREIVAKAMEKTKNQNQTRASPGQNDKPTRTELKSSDKKLLDNVSQVLENGPADMALMFTMATENGVDLKIVDDPNYVLTQEDKDKGVTIVIYEKGKTSGDIGHYSIKMSTGEVMDFKETGPMDCGYAVMGHLTGKSVDELRLETAVNIMENPTKFQEIQVTSNWIRSRHPQEATSLLMVGGARQDNQNVSPNSIILERLQSDEVKERLERELTEDEGDGYIYILKVKGQENLYKIGMTKREIETRVGELERGNNEEYEVVGRIPTRYRRATEDVTHIILRDVNEPREGIRGGTEFFRGDVNHFTEAVEAANSRVERAFEGKPQPPRKFRAQPVRINPFEIIVTNDGDVFLDWNRIIDWGSRRG